MQKKRSNFKDVEIVLMADGTVRFDRNNEEANCFVKETVSLISPSSNKQISNFIDEANSIELLLGKRILCG